MHIVTPAEIKCVAWEGEMVAPPTMYGIPFYKHGPVATIGQPAIWAVAEALDNEVRQKWVPPIGDAEYWLLRLACTLRQPIGLPRITEAQQTLVLRPRNAAAAAGATYAHSLYPDRLVVEDRRQRTVTLGPELRFGGAVELRLGQLGTRIEYIKAFPVIQSYGTGEPEPYWVFRAHPSHPLEGSQHVYVVVASRAGAGGIQALVELTATVQMPGGLARFGLSEEARAHTRFTIP